MTNRMGIVVAAMLAMAGSAWAGSHVSVGVRFGVPGCYHWHGPCFYGPWAPMYYYAPPPFYVAPMVVQPAPALEPAVPAEPTLPTPRPLSDNVHLTSWQSHLDKLRDANEGVRIDSVTQLGRSKSEQAIDPLAATLSGDQSPMVRDAAARALGVIGSTRCLPALTRAAQVDPDRDVRRSAQFAIEIIQSH